MLNREALFSISSHSNGINIIIELIRRYCSEIEQLEYQYHQHELSKQQSRGIALIQEPATEKVYGLGTDLNHLLDIISVNICEFAKLLLEPRSVVILNNSLVKI